MFKDVIYDNLEWPYIAFDNGEIYSKPNRYNGYKSKKIIPSKSHNGYHRIKLSNSPIKSKQCFVHRVIAETFIGKNDNKKYINHKNGIKTDNRLENIEWCTSYENTHHAVDNKLIKSKINSKIVKEIKKMLKNGHKSINIAKKYNINRSVISLIKNQKIWKN